SLGGRHGSVGRSHEYLVHLCLGGGLCAGSAIGRGKGDPVVDTPTYPDVTGLADYIVRLLESGGRPQDVVLQEATRVVAEDFRAGALLQFI
ncbi:MAG: hypothetical protein QOC54_830, partial [Baekduia sp.]|nr:hypothetical protein [Baekduia sp.]